ncbi:WD40 repeat-containing protein SMU1 [Trypanosoma conorhini]|uniref:WD40 repeat-containing protein SMU1 n=1 Tax=Trypanosoma conorhini TaxID=83891 RepID=A0A3R7N7M7_9TRYP|nr:WD40 repeat-containing protein SMU1 [Trypanosoma conorhini]RNF17565.1 WD40 repeat-containing protein SMU1 [Trypanosoma conorhini]
MADGVLAHEEVLRHIYSFLQAYGYKNSLLALQNESRVPFNTIDVVEANEPAERRGSVTSKTPAGLERAVLEGQWDTVLANYVDLLLLPTEVTFDLYEQIFEELLTLHGFVHAARAFFNNSPIFVAMKNSSAARYARLQQALEAQKNSFVDDSNTPGSGSIPAEVAAKRETLLRTLQEAITWNKEPYNGFLPAALWRLLNDGEGSNGGGRATSLKRQRASDLAAPSNLPSVMFLHYPLQCPKTIRRKIVFDNAEKPTSCVHTMLSTADGDKHTFAALIVGKTDGTVDFLAVDSASPVGASVGHTDGVLSLAPDAPGEAVTWVAVGYRDGSVKIYNTETRKLVRRFSQVHSSGVTSLIFAGAPSQALAGHRSWVVSGSFDGVIQVLDIREGKSLQRIADAHESKYVLSLCFLPEKAGGVVSAGNNGMLCFWSVSSAGLRQAGPARALRSIHASLKEELPTRLLPVEDAEAGSEVLVLTRGQRALLLSVHFTDDATNPVVVLMHSCICTPRPLHAGCLRVIQTPALAAPLLSLFLTDREGTILLYNVEMSWRLRAGAAEGGCRVELRPADESSVVVVDHGEKVEDLSVVNILGASASLLAFSPSLSAMYVLSWS